MVPPVLPPPSPAPVVLQAAAISAGAGPGFGSQRPAAGRQPWYACRRSWQGGEPDGRRDAAGSRDRGGGRRGLRPLPHHLGEPPRLPGGDLQQRPLDFLGCRLHLDAVVGRDRLGSHRGGEVLGSAAPPVPAVEGEPDAAAAGSSRPGGGRGDDRRSLALRQHHKRTSARLASSVMGYTLPDGHTMRPTDRLASYRQRAAMRHPAPQPPQAPRDPTEAKSGSDHAVPPRAP